MRVFATALAVSLVVGQSAEADFDLTCTSEEGERVWVRVVFSLDGVIWDRGSENPLPYDIAYVDEHVIMAHSTHLAPFGFSSTLLNRTTGEYETVIFLNTPDGSSAVLGSGSCTRGF
jgi:hypothetical protein